MASQRSLREPGICREALENSGQNPFMSLEIRNLWSLEKPLGHFSDPLTPIPSSISAWS